MGYWILFGALWALGMFFVLFVIGATPTSVQITAKDMVKPAIFTGVIAAVITVFVFGFFTLFVRLV